MKLSVLWRKNNGFENPTHDLGFQALEVSDFNKEQEGKTNCSV